MKKTLIVTEDNPEISAIKGKFAKLVFGFYIFLYKWVLKKTIEENQKDGKVVVITNRMFFQEIKRAEYKFYDALWDKIQWLKIRPKVWEKARNWFKDLGLNNFKEDFSINGIFLNDIIETRLALHLARSIYSYKNIVEKEISLISPDRVIALTLNSPPENFAKEFCKNNKISFNKILGINFFAIYPLIRKFFWLLEEKNQLQTIKTKSIAQQDKKTDILIAVSHSLHLKSVNPLIEEFRKNNLNPKVVGNIPCKEIIDNYRLYKSKALEILKTPVKFNKYIDKYLAFYFREKLSQYLALSAVYRIAAEKYLNSQKPKALIFISDRSPLESSFALQAKIFKIPTFLISPNNIMAKDEINEYKIADYVLITGRHMEDKLKEIGVDRNKIKIVGDLRFDNLPKIIKTYDDLKIRKKYNLDPDKKIILFISTYISSVVPLAEKKADLTAVSRTIEREKDYVLVIKSHPNENSKVLKEQINSWKIKGQMVGGDLYELLYVCDAVAQIASMTGFEASVFNKPIIMVNMINDYNYIIPYSQNQAAIKVTSEKEITDALRLLEDDKFRDDLISKEKNFCKNYIGVVDGKVAERVVDLVKKAMN